jgi:hypothetical protein
MKKVEKYIIFLLINSIFFVSCITKLNKFRVPDKIKYIEPQLVDTLNSTDNTDPLWINSYRLKPLITNKNQEGIYSYTDFCIHYTWYYTFMYDGENVYFTNIKDSLGMRTFLDTCGFSKFKIKKFERKVKKIKKKNDRVHQSQVF